MDNGGHRSRGSVITKACPKCHEDSSTQIETTIYGKTTVSLFCNTCAHEWREPRDLSELR